MKLLMENWRKQLTEQQKSPVIAHLVGQAGSGKTYFIENTLLKKYPEIVAKDLDDFDDNNFVQLATVENGVLISKTTSTDYNILQDELARRTYAESGLSLIHI